MTTNFMTKAWHQCQRSRCASNVQTDLLIVATLGNLLCATMSSDGRKDETKDSTRPLDFAASDFSEQVRLVVQRVVALLEVQGTPGSRASKLVSIDNVAAQKDALALSVRLSELTLPRMPESVDTLMKVLFEDSLEQGMNHSHPGFMAFIPGGGLPAAAVGQFAATLINRFTGVWMAIPGMVQLECNAVHWLCEIIGYGTKPLKPLRFEVPLPAEIAKSSDTTEISLPSPFGIFTSGGSQANFTAIFTARRVLLGDEGMSKGVLYVSSQTHHCVQKGAMLAGFPLNRVRAVEVDASLQLDCGRLEQQIQADVKEGLIPFFIAANGGTTNTGAIDDIVKVSALAVKYKCWLHVDACYGGFFRLTKRGRQLLKELHLADSVSVDCHKSLYLPHGIGCLLVRNQHHLLFAHMLNGGYMPQTSTAHVLSFCDLGMELTRPPRGVAVWFALKLYGADAFETTLNSQLDMCDNLYQRLKDIPEIEVATPPCLTALTFRRRGSPDDSEEELRERTRQLLCAINAKGRVFLSPTTIPPGRYVIRVCVLGFRTSTRDLDNLVEDIKTLNEVSCSKQVWTLPRRDRSMVVPGSV